jgi:deoxyribodipyrimidine photolyase-related protein
LPVWFWTGQTQMQCLSQCIGQTLQTGYAHHIQRLMVIGLFSTLAQLSPQQVSDWFLAVYVDAVEWVELPNVAGMALYANGGRFTSKPYVASGAYIQRMSNYCAGCQYDPKQKTGERACPFTTLYWAFLIRHEALLAANPRTRLMVKHVAHMAADEREAISAFAEQRLQQLALL